MKESFLHAIHEDEVEEAFHASGCKYFPGTKHIQKWIGPELYKEMNKRGHSSMSFHHCDCRKKITVTIDQEWKELDATDKQESKNDY